jgi:hypothetical protein
VCIAVLPFMLVYGVYKGTCLLIKEHKSG